MPSLIAPLVPRVLRHLEAYAEVAGEDAREAATLLARKLATILVAGAAALVSLIMVCVLLLALTWDGPWRAWTAAGLAVVFAVVAIAFALPILKPRAEPPRYFSRIRTELGRDRDLIERAFDGQRRGGNGGNDEQAAH
jgi:uncharacterized membrane protein YqjE